MAAIGYYSKTISTLHWIKLGIAKKKKLIYNSKYFIHTRFISITVWQITVYFTLYFKPNIFLDWKF